MRTTIEKFYHSFFAEAEQDQAVPFANKAFMFYFSIITFLLATIFISLDIAKNIQANL